MNVKWIGPVLLLVALFAADQIRINRPGHKYRLSVAVETPEGIKSASGIVAVHPDRGYSRGGATRTKGDAIFVDLGGGKNLVVLLAHFDNGKLDLDDINYVALRAFRAAGQNVAFNGMSQAIGVVPVKGALIPLLLSFGDPRDPATGHAVAPEAAEAVLGKGFRLRGVSAEVVPNGFWPVDFGGPLGEPVTRGIEAHLPWLKEVDNSAATALSAVGRPARDPIEARQAFTRK